MTQTHSIPFRLSWGQKTFAYWALAPKGHALIFVHGFGGKSVATWEEFPRLLRKQEPLSGHDLIFFGYDSKRQRAYPSALELKDFLNGFLSAPAVVANRYLDESRARAPDFQYSHVTIVAHSLGAVVVRLALLDALELKYGWTDNVQVILFAPAHSGANIVALAAQFLAGLGIPFAGALTPVVKLWWPVLTDLEPESRTLTDLLSETKTALSMPGSNLLRAKRVLLATKDTIVHPYRFAEDPPAEILKGSHTSICKPSDAFLEPYQRVVGDLV